MKIRLTVALLLSLSVAAAKGETSEAAAAQPDAATAVADAATSPSMERGSFTYQGRSLAWFCLGEGTPTLVLEAPSGVSNEKAFGNVLPALAARGRVCAYERAFYGASDPLATGEVQTVQDYAQELAAFLARAPFRDQRGGVSHL